MYLKLGIKRYAIVEHHGQLPQKIRTAIRQARKAQGRSQHDVARDVGLTQKHVSKIETGNVVPRFDTLLEILWALNYDLVLVPRHATAMVNSLVRAQSDPDALGAAEAPWFEDLVEDEGQEGQ